MRTILSRGRKQSTPPSGALTDRLNKSAEWQQTCQRLVRPTLQWIEAEPRTPRETLDREVATVVCNEMPLLPASAAGWCRQLLLDSPSLNRRLRVRLIDRLTQSGIYRDFSDLPGVTLHTMLCLLAAVRTANGGDATPLWEIATKTQETWPNLRPSAADAFLLNDLLLPSEIEAWRNVGPPALTELRELTVWLMGLRAGHTTKMPASELTRSWLTAAAFRGPRRAWSRRMGEQAGAEAVATVPEGLKPSMQRLGEAYGSMVVEWALATIRHWPDRQRLADHTPEILHTRINSLIAEIRTCLASVDNGSQLIKWLRTSAEHMTRPESDGWNQTIRFSPSQPTS
jgi:hypothetical protein